MVVGSNFDQIQPWLRSKATQQVITYDDPESLWMKGNLVKHYGLLGACLFSIDGDDVDGVLMASVRHGMGLKL
jgi:chitinase